MTKTIYFDLDGTLYDLYGIENWLPRLLNEDKNVFRDGNALLDFSELINVIVALKALGYRFGVISWTPKQVSNAYCQRVRCVKEKWIIENFGNLFDEVHIMSYGNNKNRYCKPNFVLFDDEEKNRIEWDKKGGKSYNVDNIIQDLWDLV